MSLINEALKKAQKQRTGESPSLSAVPTLGGERPDQISRRGKSTGVGEFLLPMLGLGFVGLAVLLVGGFFLYRSLTKETPPAAPTATASAPTATSAPAPTPVASPAQSAPQPVVVTPQPAVVATTPSQPASTTPAVSTFTVPNLASPATTPPEPVPSATPAVVTLPTPAPAPVVATVTPPPAQPVQVQPTKPATPPKFEPRAINHIEALRVTGIRVSTDPRDSKVLMNDRVYRLGSLIDAEMGIRLVGITAAALTFEDDRGARYTRLFN
jgi:hypothetical protein